MVPFADREPWEQKRWWPIDIKLGSVGLLGAKTFCVPHFFDYRKQPSFSLHDLPWVPMDRFKQLLIMEGKGCKTRETQLRASIGQGPVSLATDIHNNILELFLQILKTFPGGRSYQMMVSYPQACTSWTWRLMMLTLTYLTTNPSEEHPQVDHALFERLLISHYLLQAGTHSFKGINPL